MIAIRGQWHDNQHWLVASTELSCSPKLSCVQESWQYSAAKQRSPVPVLETMTHHEGGVYDLKLPLHSYGDPPANHLVCLMRQSIPHR